MWVDLQGGNTFLTSTLSVKEDVNMGAKLSVLGDSIMSATLTVFQLERLIPPERE